MTHTPQFRAQYYGARALAGLQAIADVKLHEGDGALDAAGLIAAARDVVGQLEPFDAQAGQDAARGNDTTLGDERAACSERQHRGGEDHATSGDHGFGRENAERAAAPSRDQSAASTPRRTRHPGLGRSWGRSFDRTALLADLGERADCANASRHFSGVV